MHDESLRARSWQGQALALAAGIAHLVVLCPDAGAVIVRDHRNPSRAGGAYRLEVAPIFEMRAQLAAGARVTFETRDASAGADPVLHLLAPLGGPGPVTQVAWDDDSAGNRNARLTYVPTASGTYTLVMRAAWNGRGGTAVLYQNGQRVWTALSAGGSFKRLEGLRAGEALQTIPLARGPREHVVYVVDEQGHLKQRHPSAAGEATYRVVGGAGSTEILLVASVWPAVAGPIRLVRNDVSLAGHDADGDGLGTELEADVGTCSTLGDIRGNWECSRSTDARDTDGDGLMDGVELLGRLDQPPYQLLPRWGADPRHKDLFIEVDFMFRSPGEAPMQLSRMAALDMARIYGDAETDPLLRLYHAQTLHNPDLQPGISLHLDTGVNPPANATEMEHTTYGDWGGHTWVPPVCDGDECRGADAKDVWRRQLHANRRGLFHYALGYAGGGGQAAYHTVAVNLPLQSAGVAAHELAHTLGLAHGGPEDSRRLDANCKPNYPSIMSYAYLDRGWGFFSDGYGRPVMSNTSLVERGAIANPASTAGRRYLEALRDMFSFNVDLAGGHVDWNRDGVFLAGPTQAYSNNNGSGCEMTRNNIVTLGGRSYRAPALTRLGNMTLAFFIDEDLSLDFEYTLDSLACPEAATEDCGPPLTRGSVDEPWNHGIQAFDAHPIQSNGAPAVLVVYRDDEGRLFEVTFTRENLGWTTPLPIQTSYPVTDDFSLAGDASITYLAYRNAAGFSVLKTRAPATGVWTPDRIIRDTSDGPIPPLAPGSSPALLLAPTQAGSRTLFGVFPFDDQGLLRLYTYDPVAERWSRSPWTLAEERSIGRPALAWVPMAPESPLPGRLYILSMLRDPEGHATIRDRMLTARLTQAGVRTEFGFGSDHDNVWSYGYGADLLFEAGVDTNLRSLIAAKPYREGVLQRPILHLRPKADGIVGIPLRDWNDWEVLRVDLCRTLVASGSSGIRCPAWEW